MIRAALLGALLVCPMLVSAADDPGNGTGGTGPPTEWARFAASCPTSASTAVVECGDLGDFHFGSVVNPTGCQPTADGVAALHVYPPPFPAGSPSFGLAPMIYDVANLSASPTAQAGGGAPDGTFELSQRPTRRRKLGTKPPWLAVIDFNDDHGFSTTYLADQLSGNLPTALVPLDSDAMQSLGQEVTDFHLLGALCEIVDGIDRGKTAAPLGINMSFGRLMEPGEELLSSGCADSTFSCQIAQVIADLRAEEVTFVAAAGNHDELLFPAGLPDVISAGRLDVQDSSPDPLWETPANADALAPGGHLCLNGNWVTPGGSSYSSALLSGWLADLRLHRPSVAPHVDPIWSPTWSSELNCHVISTPSYSPNFCNAELQELFAGLDGLNAQSCWDGTVQVSGTAQAGAPQQVPPILPSFDHWSDEIEPAPTGDPCVPCVGGLEEEGTEQTMQLDMSHSQPLDASVTLVAVYVRTNFSFDPVELTPELLSAFRNGQLDQLTLTGFDWPDPLRYQASLWYLLSDEANPDCDGGSRCYWDSSSILVR